MKNNPYWQCANRWGLFLAVLFVLCFIWYYLRPDPELHFRLLRQAFFGYSGMNPASFILALIQAYIWGYIGVGVWYLVGGRCK